MKVIKTLGLAMGFAAAQDSNSLDSGNSIINGVIQGGAAIIGHIVNGTTGNGAAIGRSFGVSSPFKGFLVDYGCWCFFDNDMFSRRAGRGKGGAVDAFDATCRRLQLAYRCAIMDAQAAGEICHPWGEVYAMVNAGLVGNNKTPEEITETCEHLFPDSTCGQNACLIETNFLNDLQELIDSGATMVETFKHAGGFDLEGECNRVGPTPGDNDCCGTYPERYPYNVDRRECCVDGNSAPLGRC